jgi:MFS family permease
METEPQPDTSSLVDQGPTESNARSSPDRAASSSAAHVSADEAEGWLNRNVVGMGLTSFLSDTSHEIATAVLPLFMGVIGAPAAALGAIEGTADAVSSFAKLGAGWLGDRVRHRKPLIVGGYSLTALGVGAIALAGHWSAVLAARTAAWFGRGARGPLRDSIMAESVRPSAYGRAFGFERACDSLGAVLGPALALILLPLITGGREPVASSYQLLFLIAMLPGLLSALSFAVLVKEEKRPARRLKFWATVRSLPPNFKVLMIAIALFGAGDFAHTLLTLRAVQLLTPAMGATRAGGTAIALYIAHNVVYTVMSYPIGALADRIGKRQLLVAGYLIGSMMCLLLIVGSPSVWLLGVVFCLGGLFLAAQDTLERAIAADMLPAAVRGTGFGVLATVNGVFDFVSSFVVGLLWTVVDPNVGFGYAAVFGLLGALALALPAGRRGASR